MDEKDRVVSSTADNSTVATFRKKKNLNMRHQRHQMISNSLPVSDDNLAEESREDDERDDEIDQNR